MMRQRSNSPERGVRKATESAKCAAREIADFCDKNAAKIALPLKVRPFSEIRYGLLPPQRVTVSGETIYEAGTRGNVWLVKELTALRRQAEAELKRTNPGKYWRWRYKILEHRNRTRIEELEKQISKLTPIVNEHSATEFRRRLMALRGRGGDALKREIQAAMKSDYLAGTAFKVFMARWGQGEINDLRCTVKGTGYLIEGETAKEYSETTLRTYYSESATRKQSRRVLIEDGGRTYEIDEYLQRWGLTPHKPKLRR